MESIKLEVNEGTSKVRQFKPKLNSKIRVENVKTNIQNEKSRGYIWHFTKIKNKESIVLAHGKNVLLQIVFSQNSHLNLYKALHKFLRTLINLKNGLATNLRIVKNKYKIINCWELHINELMKTLAK